MDSTTYLTYPRVPIPVGVREWPDIDIQIMPISRKALEQDGLQAIYMESGHGIINLVLPRTLIHWMFNQQIEDKSARLHETDPETWTNIALGPILDIAEFYMPGLQFSVIPAPSEEAQAACSIAITGLVDIYESDGCCAYPFKLNVPEAIWERIYKKIKPLAIDTTEDSMPIDCQLLGGSINLPLKEIEALSTGDFIPPHNTLLNEGCGVLTGAFIPDAIVEIGENTLILTDTQQQSDIPAANTSDTHTLSIYLDEISTTLGVIRTLLQENSVPMPFDTVIGTDIQLLYQGQPVATGELQQLGDVLGIRIKDISNG